MSLIELIFLSIALGIDCFVVSFSQGLIFTKNRTLNSLKLALTMGGFQGGMPIISFFATGLVSGYVESFAKWIVFAIFAVLGLNFIIGAISKEEKTKLTCISLKCLISFGIATSIDALGAGVSLKFTNTNIIEAVIIIGLGSFLLSLAGFWSGNRICKLPSKLLETIGGLILLGLAVKALL